VYRPERWLPRQQARFVDLQELIIADAEQGVWQRAAAIRAAAAIPGIGREVVLRHLDAPEVVIAEAALGALVWSDRPDGLLVVGARRLWDVRHHVWYRRRGCRASRCGGERSMQTGRRLCRRY
jgi:hypothetical protein